MINPTLRFFIRYSERNGQEDDLAAVDLHLVADGASVLALRLLLHPLDAAAEGRVGDVVDLLPEGPLRRDVLVVKATVVLLRRLAGEGVAAAARRRTARARQLAAAVDG